MPRARPCRSALALPSNLARFASPPPDITNVGDHHPSLPSPFPSPSSTPPPHQTNLRSLNALARVLRRKRTQRGALSLASPEVKFEIDTETHDPLDVGMYQVRQRAGRWWYRERGGEVVERPGPDCCTAALLLLQVREANQMVEEMMLLANCTGGWLAGWLGGCWLLVGCLWAAPGW